MGRHATSRFYRELPRSETTNSDTEAPRNSAPPSAAQESRLLRKVLVTAAALTVAAFLLLLVSNKKPWKTSAGGVDVLISRDEDKGSPVPLPAAGPPGTLTLQQPVPPNISTSGAHSAGKQEQPPTVPDGWRWDDFHNHTSSVALLTWLQKRFPDLVTVNVIGKSVQGLDIHALEITAPKDASSTYKPMFKWLGGMHGDELPSVELLHQLSYYLASMYGQDARITSLLRSVRVQIVPCLNQDGRQAHTRNNHKDKDLNRNFPLDAFSYKLAAAPTDASSESIAVRDWRRFGGGELQPETRAGMSWFQQNGPTFLSANVHGGALVANYPLDACDSQGTSAPCIAEEGELPLQLAQVYSYNHPTMHLSQEEHFQNGTINGAVWYPVIGSLQDWVYHAMHGMHLTMELHRHHMEPPQVLPDLWLKNSEPMLRFTEMVHLGLLLWVVDNTTGDFLETSVQVVSPARIRTGSSFIDHQGHAAHFKIMSPGVEYCLQVKPNGAESGRKALIREYKPVFIAAKLHPSLNEVIKGKGLEGLRLEYMMNVSAGGSGSSDAVKVGAATGEACKQA